MTNGTILFAGRRLSAAGAGASAGARAAESTIAPTVLPSHGRDARLRLPGQSFRYARHHVRSLRIGSAFMGE